MNEQQRQDYLEMKAAVELALERVDEQIKIFPAKGSDNRFAELVRKAIYYRDILRQIEEALTQN